MGIFDRLWKKDENEELRRAKSLLAEGEAERALKLARRLLKQGGPLSAEIQDLIDKAENHLAEECLAAAAHSESQGSFSDAADWIMAALTFVHDPVRIEALQQRADDLRGKGDKDTGPDFAPAPMEQESETDLDPETHFYTLTGMLREDISERYERLPEPFRQAFILANTGRLAEARDLFDQMVADNPTDPVIRFERARCALLQEHAEQARQDIEHDRHEGANHGHAREHEQDAIEAECHSMQHGSPPVQSCGPARRPAPRRMGRRRAARTAAPPWRHFFM